MRCGHGAGDVREGSLDGRLNEADVVVSLGQAISRHRV